jgi:hypothetical protein
MSVASMISSLNIGLNMTVRVMNAASMVWRVTNSLQFIADVYAIFGPGGQGINLIYTELVKAAISWINLTPTCETAKLFQPDLYYDAGTIYLLAILVIY